ncbi:DUF421 domain-containing protein [Candidatus Woesearchaeota archaeon]|nr:DUF421 domain-containing protein [Candidatus Woesearchaeota archaeon]
MLEHGAATVALRTVVIFIYTFVVLRLTGRHQLAQLTLFDFMIVIALGSAVGDVMIYGEDTVAFVHGMIAIAVVALVHFSALKLAERSYPLRVLLYGKPRLVIEHGKLKEHNLNREDITRDQLDSLLREQGVDSIREIKYAYVEPTGRLSVIPLEKGRHVHRGARRHVRR